MVRLVISPDRVDLVRLEPIRTWLQEHKIYDYWNADGERPQSGSWVGFGHTWAGEKTDIYPNNIQAWRHLAGSWPNMSKIAKRKKNIETHVESAMPRCKAPKNSDKKTFKTSIATGREELCADTQQGKTSCIEEEEKANTVYAHKIDAYGTQRWKAADKCTKSTVQTVDTILWVFTIWFICR